MMRVPYYLMASALCCAIAIGACSDGPTDVASESALSAQGSAIAKGPKEKVDICHYDADLNEGAGALVHLSVNGNSWDGGGDGCGGKENPHDKLTGHNGHELDTNWNPDTAFVATSCEAFCYEDQDGDGLTDDVDPCILDADNDSDGDGVCLSDGDTCYADPTDSDGGTDTDGDGICDEADECPADVSNDVDDDGFCPSDGDCDDENADVNPAGTEVCNGLDDDCANGVDDGGVCDAFEACNSPQVCGSYVDGCGDGLNCDVVAVESLTACWTDVDDGSGICAGDFLCSESEAIDCDAGTDCASGICLLSTCCPTALSGTCLPTGFLCDGLAVEATDLVPRLFKSQGQTAAGIH